jgi:hypothetical protein
MDTVLAVTALTIIRLIIPVWLLLWIGNRISHRANLPR